MSYKQAAILIIASNGLLIYCLLYNNQFLMSAKILFERLRFLIATILITCISKQILLRTVTFVTNILNRISKKILIKKEKDE